MIRRLKLFNREPEQIDTYIRMRRQQFGRDVHLKPDFTFSIYRTRSPNTWVESASQLDDETKSILDLQPYAENLVPFSKMKVVL